MDATCGQIVLRENGDAVVSVSFRDQDGKLARTKVLLLRDGKVLDGVTEIGAAPADLRGTFGTLASQLAALVSGLAGKLG
jgi:hypothetical protein